MILASRDVAFRGREEEEEGLLPGDLGTGELLLLPPFVFREEDRLFEEPGWSRAALERESHPCGL